MPHGKTDMFTSLNAARVLWMTELVFKVVEVNQVQS